MNRKKIALEVESFLQCVLSRRRSASENGHELELPAKARMAAQSDDAYHTLCAACRESAIVASAACAFNLRPLCCASVPIVASRSMWVRGAFCKGCPHTLHSSGRYGLPDWNQAGSRKAIWVPETCGKPTWEPFESQIACCLGLSQIF